MIKTPITIDPDATIQEALNLMRTKRLGCLPVVKGGELNWYHFRNRFFEDYGEINRCSGINFILLHPHFYIF